jgi:23S rRNA pseudouridine2605 synthase
MVMVHKSQRTDGPPSGQARSPDSASGERIAKALARAGVASRREVERYIAEGRVALNGQVLTTPAVKVEAGDILTVDGKVVGDAEPARLFRYHKPVGLMTSHNDPKGRPTVFEALPEGLPRLISVGRLDINSEGLLLLTNDGGLARGLELPATGIARRYRARARGRVTQAKLDTLKDGITVEGVVYGAIEASLDKAKEGPQGANLWITVTLAEGKNREVRRVLEALGLKVNRLIRLAYGPFALGTLNPGEIEEVGPRVIREQLAEHIAPANLPTGDRVQFQMPAGAAASGPRRGAVQIERGNLRKDDRPARYSPPNRRRGGTTTLVQGPGEGAPVGRASDARKAGKGSRAQGDAAPKKEYKPGWAKAKPSAGRPHNPKSAGGKPPRGKAVGPRSPAFRTGEVRSPEPWEAKPAASRTYAPRPSDGSAPAARPRPSGARPGEKPRDFKPRDAKPREFKPAGPKAGGFKPGGPKGPPRADAAKRPDGPSDGPYVPKTGAARRTDFAKRPGPTRGGPKPPRR